jgi:Tol biopolymer transport system component
MDVRHGNTQTWDLFMYSLGSGRLARLHINIPGRGPRTLDWSRDGKRIVVEGLDALGTGGGGAELYTVRPNGTGLRQLTTSPSSGIFDLNPRWSPNGRQVLYTRTNEDGGCEESVFVINADATNRKRVPLPCGTSNGEWSSNGAGLLVATSYTSRRWVISTNLSGTQRRHVVAGGLYASWQPR